jgi:DNA/RNA-binding domain of Phe-tRNA-synthetase-like protein
MFQISDAWKTAYPNAHAGFLVLRDVANPPRHDEQEKQKTALEAQLRSRFGGEERGGLDGNLILKAYAEYYKQFKKTYHVKLQLESIVYRQKSIPSVAALVEAMFMAEMKNMLLTAGHDFDALQLPVTLDIAREEERYILLRGQEQIAKAGDMLTRDTVGILSSIVYGPDQRTQIQPRTRHAAFVVYAPAGIDAEAVRNHLEDIVANVKVFAPQASVDALLVSGAAETRLLI